MTASRFDVQDAGLPGLKIIHRLLLEDSRGSLSRLFCAEAFAAIGFATPVSQINHTCTKQVGTVRGLHFQLPPHTETKLVTCLRGRILDVTVDLRCDSPTFLNWQGVVLSGTNPSSLLIPEGFAHGFQTLEPDCELLYLHSAPHCPEHEGGLHPADPRLAIAWPLPIALLSERDQSHPLLSSSYRGLAL